MNLLKKVSFSFVLFSCIFQFSAFASFRRVAPAPAKQAQMPTPRMRNHTASAKTATLPISFEKPTSDFSDWKYELQIVHSKSLHDLMGPGEGYRRSAKVRALLKEHVNTNATNIWNRTPLYELVGTLRFCQNDEKQLTEEETEILKTAKLLLKNNARLTDQAFAGLTPAELLKAQATHDDYGNETAYIGLPYREMAKIFVEADPSLRDSLSQLLHHPEDK